MKKTNLLAGIAFCLTGAALLILGSVSDTALAPQLGRLSFSMTFIGLCNLITWNEWRKGADSEYAGALRQAEIEQQDERNIMLRDRSAYLALRGLFILLLIAYHIFLAMDLLAYWQPFSGCISLFCLMMCLLVWAFQGIFRVIIRKQM